MIVLVARTHPAPTQTFHRRMARALGVTGTAVVRVALRRARAAGETDDSTTFPVEEGARAVAAFVRRPLRALGLLATLVRFATRGNKEGGRTGAVAAWRDGLRLFDWSGRRPGIARFHAQFASWEASAAWVAARMAGVRFSFEIHNPYTFVKGRALLRRKCLAADVIAVISEDARRRTLELVPEVADRLVLVRCGIDLATVPPRGTGGPDVLAVGSLVPRKGHDVLVRALARLRARHPDLDAAIVGEGPERARLEGLARELGAPVRWLGALPEAEAVSLAGRARVVALACIVAPDGDEDGIPVALMEAMAAGTPVVSTPVGGIAELLEDGDAGLLVAQNDPVALAAAIDRLLVDPALRERIGARGRRAIEARHDLSRCARTLADALAARPAAGADHRAPN